MNSMATRRFGESSLAEEAALFVMDGLQADNWQRVRAFAGNASFSTYISILTTRLLEDFARKRFGRVRPPLWIKSLGGIWEKLFTALCLERLSVGDAVEVVAERQFTTAQNEINDIEDAAHQLLGKIPDCGKKSVAEVSYADDHPPQTIIDEGSDQSSSLEKRERQQLLNVVFELTCGKPETQVPENFAEKFKLLKINLTPEEKLLLKLCYQNGLRVTKAGQFLGLTRFQVHGKMRRLMARLKSEFERTGLAQELRDLLKS
jgi:DNA-directed RNA polymerase specialized sigma24 family protein